MQGDPHGPPALQACVSIKSEGTTGDMTLEQPLSQLRALFWTPFPHVTLQVDQFDHSVNTGSENITCKKVVWILWFQLERWAYVESYSLNLEICFCWLQEFEYPICEIYEWDQTCTLRCVIASTISCLLFGNISNWFQMKFTTDCLLLIIRRWLIVGKSKCSQG